MQLEEPDSRPGQWSPPRSGAGGVTSAPCVETQRLHAQTRAGQGGPLWLEFRVTEPREEPSLFTVDGSAFCTSSEAGKSVAFARWFTTLPLCHCLEQRSCAGCRENPYWTGRTRPDYKSPRKPSGSSRDRHQGAGAGSRVRSNLMSTFT